MRSRQRSAILALLFLTSDFCLLSSSYAATHVTATYDLGSNPRVMATVNGTPEYGLVFAQRNKPVLYNGIEYGTNVVAAYLDATGQLNDGAGNAWLELIPNPAAAPADSYYVVTVNIQGHVHSEIWVVPDVPTVSAELCRQAQPPSPTAPALFYQFLQKDGAALTQRSTLNLQGSGVACSDNAGQLRTDCTFTGGGSGSAPLASATTSGTVKTDTTASDPVVYLKSSTDTLLAGKANSAHTHAESDVSNLVSDLAGKAPLTHTHAESDVTNLVADLAATEKVAHRNAANGYAGLNTSSKLAASQMQEVISSADLTDFGNKSGSGTTIIGSTITTPSDGQCLTYASGDWVNGSCASGSSNHNLLSATHPDTVAASPVLGDLLYANSTPAWTKLAGNTASTKKFLTQTGTGSVSAAPAWGTIAAGDLPSHTHAESDVTNLVTDLSGKVPTTRNVSTTSPLMGGGALSADLSLSCPTCELTGHKDAANGYAGLNASSKITASQMQEVLGAADLTDYSGTSGSGSTAIRVTITSPASNDVLTWNGSNWINQAPSGGSSHNLLSATHSDTSAGTVQRGDLITGQGATPKWTRLAKGTAGQCLQMDGSATDIIWGACGSGSGASTALDNLTSPTAINQSLLFGSDNSKDIGANGASRPASIYAGTAVNTPVLNVGTGSGNLTLKAGSSGEVAFLDATDGTKIAAFDLSNIATNTTRTVTVPNANSILPQSYSCTNQVATALNGATGATTCSTLTLAGTAFANQGSTSTLLHGNASGNPSWGGVSLTSDAAANQGTTTTVLHGNASGQPSFGSVTGSDMASATVGSTQLSAPNKTITRSINIFSPTTSDTNAVQIYYGQAITITRVACSTDTGTVTIQFDERAEATPNTAGTNVLSGTLTCDTDSQTTTSFSNAGIGADLPLNLQIMTTSGTPGVVRIHVDATID